MKHRNLLVFSLLTSILASTSAQGLIDTQKNAKDAQLAFDGYWGKQKNTNAGAAQLIKIQNDLPKSKKNVDALRQLIGEKVSEEEKLAAIRLLGAMYDRNNSHGENGNIKRDLKNQINSSDKKIATTALFSFTRTGYDADYLEIIRRAKERGLVDDAGYYGEHAHLFRFSPESVQKVLLDEIAKSRNSYGLEVLAADLKSQEEINYSSSIKKQILETLKNNEPTFPKAIGEYGGAINYYYENWVYAIAKLSNTETGASSQKTIYITLSKSGTDPRKILAFLSSPTGSKYIKESKDIASLKDLFSKACQYTNSFPTTNYIQAPARKIEEVLSTSYQEFKGISCASYD